MMPLWFYWNTVKQWWWYQNKRCKMVLRDRWGDEYKICEQCGKYIGGRVCPMSRWVYDGTVTTLLGSWVECGCCRDIQEYISSEWEDGI